MACKLVYSEYGKPSEVVKKCEDTPKQPGANEVLVKMLASSINPADILTIQGAYPSQADLPAIPGNEGVGKVIAVGDGVEDFKIGDHVVPMTNRLGTWRSHLTVTKELIKKVPKELGLVEASTFTVNPCTAYRMLKDFEELNPGDVVLQNGGNSACGQNVIQLARIWGIKTVTVVRDRPQIDELRKFLKMLGATVVLTEKELKETDLFSSGKLPKPKLALNCVGGECVLDLLKYLDYGGTLVTYGGMSGKPISVNMGDLIFRDLKLRGYWMTEWNKRNFSSPVRKQMHKELLEYMLSGELKGPLAKMVLIKNYKDALDDVTNGTGMLGVKNILCFDD